MSQNTEPEPDRPRSNWVWVGVVAMSAAAVAALRLEEGVTRIVVGAALALCLLAVGGVVWMEHRESRRSTDLGRK